jgi:hypothetical protein
MSSPSSQSNARRGPLARFDRFIRAVRARLERGAIEYGDTSFSSDLPTLIAELEQEAEDLAGWAYITWRRIRNLRRIAEDVERRVAARSEADDGR